MTNVFPSYADIMKKDEDVKVAAVSQHYILKALNIEQGICGGLSVQQIKATLNPNMPKATKNLFKSDEDIEESVRIAEETDRKLGGFVDSLKNTPFLKAGPTIGVSDDVLEPTLNSSVQKTIDDGNARGMFIGIDTERCAKYGTPLDGGHALSFTAKKKDGEIYCAAMDSNMFFAKGRGMSGCNKITKKLVDTVMAYGGSNITLIEAEAHPQENMKMSVDLLSTRGLARGMK